MDIVQNTASCRLLGAHPHDWDSTIAHKVHELGLPKYALKRSYIDRKYRSAYTPTKPDRLQPVNYGWVFFVADPTAYSTKSMGYPKTRSRAKPCRLYSASVIAIPKCKQSTHILVGPSKCVSPSLPVGQTLNQLKPHESVLQTTERKSFFKSGEPRFKQETHIKQQTKKRFESFLSNKTQFPRCYLFWSVV